MDKFLRKKCKITLCILLFFLNVFMTFSCSIPSKKNNRQIPNFTKKEKENLENFFFCLMLRHSGIYVLQGSKPMCSAVIFITTPEQEEEIYRELAEEGRDRPAINKSFHWQDWEPVKKRINMNNYIITVREIPSWNSPYSKEIFFMNIANTINVLLKHYSFFKDVVGFDFDPLDKIYEIENNTSIFWKKILNNYTAMGILFGYGEENSRFFEYWSHGIDTSKGQSLDYFNHIPFNAYDNLCPILDKGINYQNFPLPTFRHLKNDLILEKYKKERKQIKKLYKGKNPLEVTLKKLMEKKDVFTLPPETAKILSNIKRLDTPDTAPKKN